MIQHWHGHVVYFCVRFSFSLSLSLSLNLSLSLAPFFFLCIIVRVCCGRVSCVCMYISYVMYMRTCYILCFYRVRNSKYNNACEFLSLHLQILQYTYALYFR